MIMAREFCVFLKGKNFMLCRAPCLNHQTNVLTFSNLIWKLENGDGLCLDYPHIALHAVSSDLNSFPHECLYVMLDNNIMSKKKKKFNFYLF